MQTKADIIPFATQTHLPTLVGLLFRYAYEPYYPLCIRDLYHRLSTKSHTVHEIEHALVSLFVNLLEVLRLQHVRNGVLSSAKKNASIWQKHVLWVYWYFRLSLLILNKDALYFLLRLQFQPQPNTSLA